MKGLNLSKTSLDILKVYFENLGRSFYINELIRETGRYPNSIQQALKSLEKQKILTPSRRGRLKLFKLNESYVFLREVKAILNRESKPAKVPQRKEINWVKVLNRPSSYPFGIALCKSNATLDRLYGVAAPTFWVNDITYGVYYSRDELTNIGKVISEKIELDIGFARKDVLLCRKMCDRLVNFTNEISKMSLVGASGKKILKIVKKFYDLYFDVLPFVTVPHAVERYFENNIKALVKSSKDYEILLSPVYTEDDERNAAFKIALYAQKNGFDRKYKKLLNTHWKNYCWYPLWNLDAEALTLEYFDDEIRSILKNVKNPKKELERATKESRDRKKILKNTLRKINASRGLADQVMLLQQYIFLRTYRKNAISRANYCYLSLLDEVASRLGLNLGEVKLLSFEEIVHCLSNRKDIKKLEALAKARSEGWAVLMLKGKIRTVSGVKNIVETMERYKIVSPGLQATKVVKGNSACRGRVTGKVKIVRELSELGMVGEGDILVTKMTTPDYVMAMHKAAAIVTDEGGRTCHAAIVSREFKTPCIVGTINATQILSDNDVVEVDANEGIVRVIEAVDVDENIKQIYGKTAYKGKIKGSVRIVLDANDFSKVKEGDVLVTSQTTPEFLSSLYKVKGFVVDEDSITSHAMLCAKALKLPAVIGTQFARDVLKDGEVVELDATKGVIIRK
jgi:phosphohistidine swiveling domain-containing protein